MADNTNRSPPSLDPASYGDFSGVIRFVLTKLLQNTDDMLPAQVIAYDRTTNRARVQPLIAVVTTDNIRIDRAQVASVPVLQPGGGGFVMSFPIKTGDLGWIKANDSDISLFLQNLQNSSPNTARLHSFEDAIFIPDTMFKSVTIDPADTDNVVIQSLDGTCKISMGATSIAFTSATLTHNGVNIGSTHVHGGVQSGGSDTGVPV